VVVTAEDTRAVQRRLTFKRPKAAASTAADLEGGVNQSAVDVHVARSNYKRLQEEDATEPCALRV
jgi:hypothetical protein